MAQAPAKEEIYDGVAEIKKKILGLWQSPGRKRGRLPMPAS